MREVPFAGYCGPPDPGLLPESQGQNETLLQWKRVFSRVQKSRSAARGNNLKLVMTFERPHAGLDCLRCLEFAQQRNRRQT